MKVVAHKGLCDLIIIQSVWGRSLSLLYLLQQVISFDLIKVEVHRADRARAHFLETFTSDLSPRPQQRWFLLTCLHTDIRGAIHTLEQ